MFSCLIYAKTSTRETTCGFNLFGVCWMDLWRKGLCLKDPAFVALALWPDDYPEKQRGKFGSCAQHFWLAH